MSSSSGHVELVNKQTHCNDFFRTLDVSNNSGHVELVNKQTHYNDCFRTLGVYNYSGHVEFVNKRTTMIVSGHPRPVGPGRHHGGSVDQADDSSEELNSCLPAGTLIMAVTQREFQRLPETFV